MIRYKYLLPMVCMGLCALSSWARPPERPQPAKARVAHISVADEDFYLPLPPGYSGELAGVAQVPGHSWFRVHLFPRGQNEGNWTEMMTLMVFIGPAQPLGVAQASLHSSCLGSFGVEAAPVPAFATPVAGASAVAMSCSAIVARNGPAIYGYYLGISGKDHSYLLTRERRDAQFGKFMDWHVLEMPQWSHALARFTVCRAGTACLRDANEVVVTEARLQP